MKSQECHSELYREHKRTNAMQNDGSDPGLASEAKVITKGALSYTPNICVSDENGPGSPVSDAGPGKRYFLSMDRRNNSPVE